MPPDEAMNEPAEAINETAPQLTGLARLRATKAAGESDSDSFVLPLSGVTVTCPKFRSYGTWVRANRIGDGDTAKGQTAYIVMTCKFDGERITMTDYEELMQTEDHIAILTHVFSAPRAEGNGNAA